MLNEENLAALLVVQEFIHHRRVVAKTQLGRRSAERLVDGGDWA